MNEILNHYLECALHLAELVLSLPESDLDLSENNQGWTIRQYVHHVADGDDLWKGFIKRAAAHPAGQFTLDWYWQLPQGDWVDAWRYAGRAVQPSIDLLLASRAHVVQLLGCIPGALEQRLEVCWPGGETEQVSVADVIGMQTRHVEGHAADIQRILDRRE